MFDLHEPGLFLASRIGFCESGKHVGIPGLLGLVECLIGPVKDGVDGLICWSEPTGTDGYCDMLNLFVFGMELMGPDQQVDSFQLLMKCSFRHGREYEDEFIATPADQRIALTDTSVNRCYNFGEYAVAKIMSVGIIDIL